MHNSINILPFSFTPDAPNLPTTHSTSLSPSPITSTLPLSSHASTHPFSSSQMLSLSSSHLSIPGAYTFNILQYSLFMHIPTYIILELTFIIAFTHIHISSLISNSTPSLPFPLRLTPDLTPLTPPNSSLLPPSNLSHSNLIYSTSNIRPVSSLFSTSLHPLPFTLVSTPTFHFLGEQGLEQLRRGGPLGSRFTHDPA